MLLFCRECIVETSLLLSNQLRGVLGWAWFVPRYCVDQWAHIFSRTFFHSRNS